MPAPTLAHLLLVLEEDIWMCFFTILNCLKVCWCRILNFCFEKFETRKIKNSENLLGQSLLLFKQFKLKSKINSHGKL